MKLPVYLDHHATTPVDQRVLDGMLPFFTERFGNPSSKNHSFGREADKAVDRARQKVAQLIGAHPSEIVFTSGATESINIALRCAHLKDDKKKHVITSKIEHPAVLRTCEELERQGCKISYLSPDSMGLIRPEQVEKAIRADTRIVSIMQVNNEIGVINPLKEIGQVTKKAGVLFHNDAAQAVARISSSVDRMCVDLFSISGHKMYGPKGIGTLYIRRSEDFTVEPFTFGGGQERGLRSGTLNVPGIVGFGIACEIAKAEMKAESIRIEKLRDTLTSNLRKELDGIQINGSETERVVGNLNVTFEDVEAEQLLMEVGDKVALSSSSACCSGSAESSHVLKAIGLSEKEISCSVRFGIGRENTAQEINFVSDVIIQAVKKIREFSSGKGSKKGVLSMR